MGQELVVALLLNKYMEQNPNTEIPVSFNRLSLDEKIDVLNKALKDNKKIDELI